MLETW